MFEDYYHLVKNCYFPSVLKSMYSYATGTVRMDSEYKLISIWGTFIEELFIVLKFNRLCRNISNQKRKTHVVFYNFYITFRETWSKPRRNYFFSVVIKFSYIPTTQENLYIYFMGTVILKKNYLTLRIIFILFVWRI